MRMHSKRNPHGSFGRLRFRLRRHSVSLPASDTGAKILHCDRPRDVHAREGYNRSRDGCDYRSLSFRYSTPAQRQLPWNPELSKARRSARKTAGGALAAKSHPPTLTGMGHGRFACRVRMNAATHRQPCGRATNVEAAVDGGD